MKIFPYALIFILFMSCMSEQRSKISTSKNSFSGILKLTDSVAIPLGKTGFYRSLQTHVIKRGDNTILYRENRLNGSIDILNWTTKKLGEQLDFSDVPRFGSSAFLPLSGDSIFIGSLEGSIIMAKNDSIISIQEPIVMDTIVRYSAHNPFKPVRFNSEILMSVPSNYYQSDPRFKTRPLLASYNITTGNLFIPAIHYPDYFNENCWSQHQFEIVFTKNTRNELVYSFQTDPAIFVYNPEEDEIISRHDKIKSMYVDSIPPYTACDFSDVTTYFKYLKSIARYRSIIYDKYRDVYYRIVSLPTPEEPDGQRDQDIITPLSIMVLDNNFKIITERKLPARTFDPIDYFINEQGFWLSLNNEGSDSFNENTISYALFSLERFKENISQNGVNK